MPHFMIVLILHINLLNISWIIKCLLFKEYGAFNTNSVDRVLWRLIWVYTVCQCPIYGALGINRLILLNVCCGYSFEAPQRCTSNKYPLYMFLPRNMKRIFIWTTFLSGVMIFLLLLIIIIVIIIIIIIIIINLFCFCDAV